MSPSGGLRGRRGSILGTAVQLGRRGYDSVHFCGHYILFLGVGRSYSVKAGDVIPERTVEGFFVSRKVVNAHKKWTHKKSLQLPS